MRLGRWQFPDAFHYDEGHQWVRFEDGEAVIGITDYSQETAGDILYLELPAVGTSVQAGEAVGSVEAGKWVGRLLTPVDGEVVAINAALAEEPGRVNRDPYGEGWLMRLRLTGGRVPLRQGSEYLDWLKEQIGEEART